MDADLHQQATRVKMTIARSGRHYLLADRWGTWLMVDGSSLLTRVQVERLVAAEIRERYPKKEMHRLTMEFLKP